VIISLAAIEYDLEELHKILGNAAVRLDDIATELSTDGFENITVDDLVNCLREIRNTFDDCL